MRKTYLYLLSLGAMVCLSFGLLTGCGRGEETEVSSAEEEDGTAVSEGSLFSEVEASPEDDEAEYGSLSLVGAWDNDEIQSSLVFNEDGTVEHYELMLANYFKGCAYEWDGENVVLHFIKKGVSLTGTMDEEGDLIFDAMDGWFTRVDEASYAFEAEYSDFIDESEGDELDLSGLAWETDGYIYNFYDDNLLVVTDPFYEEIHSGSYAWDGQSGYIDIAGGSADIAYYRGNFYLPREGGYQPYTLIGEADPELLNYIDEGAAW